MRISDNIVFSKSLKNRKLRKYVEKINRASAVPGVFVVVLNKEDANMMSVISVHELYAMTNRGHKLDVIGISKSRNEAKELIGYICQNVVDHYGGIDKEKLMKEFHL